VRGEEPRIGRLGLTCATTIGNGEYLTLSEFAIRHADREFGRRQKKNRQAVEALPPWSMWISPKSIDEGGTNGERQGNETSRIQVEPTRGIAIAAS